MRAVAYIAAVALSACAHAGVAALDAAPTTADLEKVSPALAHYTTDLTRGSLWQQPELSARDRSLVTVSALIARADTVELPLYLERALDAGVTPAEISEAITQLAFYAGWSRATAAVPATLRAFERRHVRPDQLPAASPQLMAIDEAAEAQRAERVQQSFGNISPSLVRDTTDVLFRNLWLRPGLAPRDRSLVTVAALIATGQSAQLTYHLNRAMDYGLTAVQVGGVLTQLAYVSGWPSVFSSLPVAKDVIEKRSHPETPRSSQ